MAKKKAAKKPADTGNGPSRMDAMRAVYERHPDIDGSAMRAELSKLGIDTEGKEKAIGVALSQLRKKANGAPIKHDGAPTPRKKRAVAVAEPPEFFTNMPKIIEMARMAKALVTLSGGASYAIEFIETLSEEE